MKHTIIFAAALTVLMIIVGVYVSRSGPITNHPSQGTDIIAFGDSLIEGVGATEGNDVVSVLSKKTGRPIVNLGHSGDTTRDGGARIDALDAYHPKVVMVLLGGNDTLKKIPEEETRENLAAIIEDIHARGAVVLLLGVRGGLLSDDRAEMYESLRDTYHTAYVQDVLDGLFGDRRYMSDAIHPNDAGYAEMAERIYPVLMEVIE